MIKKELEKLGLSEKESAVYMACLEIGESQVPKIAQHAGTQRPITYVVLESLNKKGLVSMLDKKGKTHYVAENPINLKRLVEKHKAEIYHKEQVVKDVMPGLESIFKMMGDRPVIRFFEGIEGIKTVSENMTKIKGNEILVITSLDEIFRMFPERKNSITNQKRVKKGIHSRVIYTHEEGKLKEMSSRKMLREARYVNANKLKLRGDITIFDNKLAITSLSGKTPISIIIEDGGVAGFLRDIFELAWVGAKNI